MATWWLLPTMATMAVSIAVIGWVVIGLIRENLAAHPTPSPCSGRK